MSIGFTVPFLSLIRQPFAGAKQVGLLTTAFGTFRHIPPSPMLIRLSSQCTRLLSQIVLLCTYNAG